MNYDLGSLDAPDQNAIATGKPLQLALDAIDEDPRQPRTEFEGQGLQELADSIAERGVRVPISVRSHPDRPGRWMVNAGARRVRACRMLGRVDIPAFVDETFDSYDQVIENEQREGLKPIELALFIERELATGLSQAEIARRLGKSKTYVGFICALIDPPDWLLGLYRQGRCRGVKELHDLRRLQESHPVQVLGFVGSREFVSRGDVEALRAQVGLADPASTESDPVVVAISQSAVEDRPRGASGATLPKPSSTQPSAPSQPKRRSGPVVLVMAEHEGQLVRVVIDRRPLDNGSVFVCVDEGESLSIVGVDTLRAVRLILADPAHHQSGNG
ncbi:MAG: ParB/RepB/Spo0J family partition protein [Burkholderiaceae bacterium]